MEVNYHDRSLFLLVILEYLKESCTDVKKTLVQKAIFIFQEAFKVDLGYKYKLHFYGPYSAELTNDLNYLESQGLINMEFGRDLAYKISIGKNGIDYAEKAKLSTKKEDIKSYIDKLLSIIPSKFEMEVELIATALYFLKLPIDDDRIRRSIKFIKPEFADSKIERAIKIAKNIMISISSG